MRLGDAWAGLGVAAHFRGPDMECRGGNCTTWRFDTPATRRWKASCSAKPPFCSMRRRNQAPRWLRLAEAWAGLAVCGAFGRFSRFYVGSSGGCNGGNCSIRGATRRRHAVRGLLVLPNPQACGLVRWCWGRWGAFRFLVREPIVVGVNVAAIATNRCNELVSHCRGGRWRHNPRLTTLIGRWPLSPFSQRRGRGRVLPFALGFRGANTG